MIRDGQASWNLCLSKFGTGTKIFGSGQKIGGIETANLTTSHGILGRGCSTDCPTCVTRQESVGRDSEICCPGSAHLLSRSKLSVPVPNDVTGVPRQVCRREFWDACQSIVMSYAKPQVEQGTLQMHIQGRDS